MVRSASPIMTYSMLEWLRHSAGLAEGCSPLSTVVMFVPMLFAIDATSYAGYHQPENGMLIPTTSGDHCLILAVISSLLNPWRYFAACYFF
jgi:hypothetical protein